jgi:ankyrin repeat protein
MVEDAKRRNAEPALRRAMETNNAKYLKALLDVGTNASAKDWDTALLTAAGKGHVDVVNTLLSAGADKEASTARRGFTPLHRAAESGHLEVVELLLSVGANIEAKTDVGFGFTPLNGITPLHDAVKSGRLEVVELLLSAGANIEAKTDIGFTPLIEAAFDSRAGSHVEIARVLLAAGADKQATNVDGHTAVNCRGKYTDPKIIEALLGDRMVATNRLIEALEAMDLGRAEETLRLPNHPPMLNHALCIACASKRITALGIFWLIKKGADVNGRGTRRWSPLHEVVASGSEEEWVETEVGKNELCQKVRLLIAHGADMTAVEEHGLTPLGMARHLNNHTAVALLTGTSARTAWEQAHPIETSYVAMSTQLVRDHGLLERVEYLSHWPKFEIKFYYRDGTSIYSGQRTGKHDINFLSLGYVGEGPRYARHFLEAAGFNLTTDEIACIKVGDNIVVRDGKAVLIKGQPA